MSSGGPYAWSGDSDEDLDRLKYLHIMDTRRLLKAWGFDTTIDTTKNNCRNCGAPVERHSKCAHCGTQY